MTVKKRWLFFLIATMLLTGCEAAPDPSTVKRADPLMVAADTATADGATIESSGQGEKSKARNFYFVLDDSRSMWGEVPTESKGRRFDSKLAAAKWAVMELLKTVPDDVNLGLSFLNQGEVVPLGPNNRASVLETVRKWPADGSTPLGTAIGEGVDKLVSQYKKQLGYGEFRVIVVTDGESTEYQGDFNRGIGELVKYSEAVQMYTIGFGTGTHDHALNQYSVSYWSANSADELKSALSEAVSELEVFEPSYEPEKR